MLGTRNAGKFAINRGNGQPQLVLAQRESPTDITRTSLFVREFGHSGYKSASWITKAFRERTGRSKLDRPATRKGSRNSA